MKTFLSLTLVGALLAFCCLAGCNTTDDSLSEVVVRDTWKVDTFLDNGDDHTDDFDGYLFVFLDGGAVTATRLGVDVHGTWDAQDGDRRFSLFFATGFPLNGLSERWIVDSFDSGEVRLHKSTEALTQLRLKKR